MTIQVYRGDGTRRGDDIQDALLGFSRQAALARGRGELNAYAHRWQQIDLTMPYRSDLALGDLVSVTDPYSIDAGPWVGRVIRLSHQVSRDAMLTVLTVARPDV